MAVLSAHVALDLDAKTAELYAKRMVQGRWRFILVKRNTPTSFFEVCVLVA